MFKEYVRADEYLITALLYLPKDMDVKRFPLSHLTLRSWDLMGWMKQATASSASC